MIVVVVVDVVVAGVVVVVVAVVSGFLRRAMSLSHQVLEFVLFISTYMAFAKHMPFAHVLSD